MVKGLHFGGLFYLMDNKIDYLRLTDMVINADTTGINFYPFIDFEGLNNVTIQVWHKNTKTKVQGTSQVFKIDSQISLDVPSLAAIAAVAKNLDTCLIRVFNGNTLYWEYLATWSDNSTNINKDFKSWDTTENIQPLWVTL